MLGGEQIRRVVIAAVREAALDDPVDRAGDLIEQSIDVIVPRWRQRMKLNGAVMTGREHTVGYQRMGMGAALSRRARRE